MKKLWYGSIDGIFGYGISAISKTKKGAMVALEKRYDEWKEGLPDPETNFRKSFDYWGGYVVQVELDKGYHEGLRE